MPLPEPLRRSRRLRPARGVAVAVTAAAVTAGLAGWLLGGMSSAAAPDQHTAVRPSATAAAGPLAAAPVQVSGGALDGLPVTAVRRQLRQLGLRVLVLWRPSGQQPPGTVLSVQPDGRVPAGSIVVVTAALQPLTAAVTKRSTGRARSRWPGTRSQLLPIADHDTTATSASSGNGP